MFSPLLQAREVELISNRGQNKTASGRTKMFYSAKIQGE